MADIIADDEIDSEEAMEPDLITALDFVDWINYGIDMGWCTTIYCDTHDGPQLTEEEAKEWDEGGDPCMTVVRIW